MSSGALVFKSALSREELEAALELRTRVFTDEQGISEDLDRDGQDLESEHVLVLDGEKAVATGRLLRVSSGEGVLARIAVDAGYRGRGLGGAVVHELEALAWAQGIESVSLKPHRYLEAFYARLGYVADDGVEVVAGHELILMRKSLAEDVGGEAE